MSYTWLGTLLSRLQANDSVLVATTHTLNVELKLICPIYAEKYDMSLQARNFANKHPICKMMFFYVYTTNTSTRTTVRVTLVRFVVFILVLVHTVVSSTSTSKIIVMTEVISM